MIPKNEAEIAEAIASANGPIVVQGGGTRGIGAKLDGSVLNTHLLSGVQLYEPGSLTIVAQAGTPVAEIEKILEASGQRLSFEPMDHRGLLGRKGTPTIGGVVAANVSGPRRVQSGACRDFLLGVRFVDGQGNIIKNGGRVMKNVTGYDLVKLMAGSFGTLGVLSEVSLKVLPKSDVTATVSISGLSDTQGQKALSTALRSPFDVSGAAHAPIGLHGPANTMIRVEGFTKSVKYRAEQLQSLLAGFGQVDIDYDSGSVQKTWEWVRDVGLFQGQSGDVWRISVKPTDGPSVASRLPADGLLYDWGGGLIWTRVPEGTDVRASLNDLSGHATIVRSSKETAAALAVFQPEPAPIAAISAGLRAKFDPRGILNPGLMG